MSGGSINVGREHSYFDENCTCKFDDPYYDKSKCPANKEFVSNDTALTLSFGAYLGIGGEASISFDVDAWCDEVISIS